MGERLDSSWWSQRTVLVTGHTGFKGSWLCEMLLALNAKVIGIGLAPDTEPNLFDSLGLSERIYAHHLEDVRTPNFLSAIVNNEEPDVIIHMAAQSLVSEGYANPFDTFEINVMGTVQLLEAVRLFQRDIPVAVISSDKCYRNRDYGERFSESDPLGGHDPYSASKAGTEIVCGAYRDSFFSSDGSARLMSFRAGNVIGGGDWCKNRLVPDIIKSFVNRKAALIRNPTATRPWQHVLEPLNAYLIAIQAVTQKRDLAGEWNIGPRLGNGVPVIEVAEKIRSFWDKDAELEFGGSGVQFREAKTLGLDASKFRNAIGSYPEFSIDQSIELTANWYKEYYSDIASAKEITQSQINSSWDQWEFL